MVNFKRLMCNHEYKYYGLYYVEGCDNYAGFYYNICALHKCTKCGKANVKLISTKYFKAEIPDNVLTKTEMYDKVYKEITWQISKYMV